MALILDRLLRTPATFGIGLLLRIKLKLWPGCVIVGCHPRLPETEQTDSCAVFCFVRLEIRWLACYRQLMKVAFKSPPDISAPGLDTILPHTSHQCVDARKSMKLEYMVVESWPIQRRSYHIRHEPNDAELDVV